MPKTRRLRPRLTNFNEVSLMGLGPQQMNPNVVQQILISFWNNGVVVDTLVVTPAQLNLILKWHLDQPDISKPINFDLSRMKIRVHNSFPGGN